MRVTFVGSTKNTLTPLNGLTEERLAFPEGEKEARPPILAAAF
jgi:hypothetical protein